MHDDNRLMELVKMGDKDAFEVIVLKHRAAAIRFAYSFVRDAFTAEDIAQESFARVYVNRMSYRASFSFKTYLFTIIRNCCIDNLRRSKKPDIADFADVYEIRDLEMPESLLMQKERMKTVYEILAGLKDDYRTALYLFAFDEMSYTDIAKVMKKTIPQVKILIFRARKKLKSLCEGADLCEK